MSDVPRPYRPEDAVAAVEHMAATMGLDIEPPTPGAAMPKPEPLNTKGIPPAVQGPHARAWLYEGKKVRPDQDATLRAYVLNFPASHPFWPTYLVAVVHLRDIPGVPPANKHYPEAEYEFMIVALDPQGNPGHPLTVDDIESFRHLTPINVTVQFNAANDEDAKRRCTDAVTLICEEGIGIEPDDDARVRPFWKFHISRGFGADDGQHR